MVAFEIVAYNNVLVWLLVHAFQWRPPWWVCWRRACYYTDLLGATRTSRSPYQTLVDRPQQVSVPSVPAARAKVLKRLVRRVHHTKPLGSPQPF
jgi:hypothetical protein